jgi:hypothetical protein
VAVPGLPAGQRALFARVATVSPRGVVDITHSLGGAQYRLNIGGALSRWQMLLAMAPDSGRVYAASTVQLHYRGVLGTNYAPDKRGFLHVQEADLAEFEGGAVVQNSCSPLLWSDFPGVLTQLI